MASPRVANPCGPATSGSYPCGFTMSEQPLVGWPLVGAHCWCHRTAGRPCKRCPTSDRACRRLPPLRSGRTQPPSVQGALAVASCPFAGGLGHSRPLPCRWLVRGRLPLQESWPWLATHPPPRCMKKMNEVKNPPL
ncbi:hypothetical protein GW17_00062291 [Ensete ventricosum]|nr:hypothetical protein GW17_00062291 [Ensete ventricosum]